MLTNVQGLVNELTTYQIPEGFKLGGKGPAMKKLAQSIKDLFPSLSADDKRIFLEAIARGRFAINVEIWALFLASVGIEAPAPTLKSTPAPAPATNKVAAEILEHCQYAKVSFGLVNDTLAAMLLIMERQADRITILSQQVEALKKPAPRRVAKLAAV